MRLGSLEVTTHPKAGDAIAGLAALWFVCGIVAFIAAGVDQSGHRHRFEHGGYWFLIGWLAPYAIVGGLVLLASLVSVRHVPRSSRVAELVTRTEELERSVGL